MIRLSKSILAVVGVLFLSVPLAFADFLVGDPYPHFAAVFHNDGTPAVTRTGGPNFSHESYDQFTLSGDAEHIFLFANDLGYITTESWNAKTGVYEGAVGPNNAWPTFIQPTWTIDAVHTRGTYPIFSGDLLYVGRVQFSDKPLINLVNTATHEFVGQLIPPPSVTQIYDFTLGSGSAGPKTRLYTSTNSGVLVYDEISQLIGVDPNTFHPIFATGFQPRVVNPALPITFSANASFDIGPDGYLYALDGVGSLSSIKRYNTETGALIDTFLTFSEYSYSGLVGQKLKFGPDGGLYFFSQVISGPHVYVTRFDIGSRQRTDFDLGTHYATNFYVLPVPEPHILAQLLVGAVLLILRRRPS